MMKYPEWNDMYKRSKFALKFFKASIEGYSMINLV